jgi:hypothetical protein
VSGLNLARARTEAETKRSDSNRQDVLEYRRTLQTVLFFEGYVPSLPFHGWVLTVVDGCPGPWATEIA